METIFPAKAFFKIITQDDNVKEVHYISADNEGNLFLEKHNSEGVTKTKLIPKE